MKKNDKNWGLHRDNTGTWIYTAANAVVTAEGLHPNPQDSTGPFALQINERCGTAEAVHAIYNAMIDVKLTNSRSLGLIVAVTSAWLSIFAEFLKSQGFQIPAAVYIGEPQSGKTSFAKATSLLRATANGPPLSITAGTKKKIACEIFQTCRHGQLIVSDLRKEGPRSRGINVELLDNFIRPVAEEPDTPGSLLITAETDFAKSKDLLPSMRERLLWVPMDGLMDTQESVNWMKNAKDQCLVGNLIATLLPFLLTRLNTHGALGGNGWRDDLKIAYREYSEVHFTPRHLREENMRFLIRYSHEELLHTAQKAGLISQQQYSQYLQRVEETSDWFFKRQLLISDPLGENRMSAILESLCISIRRVETRIFCASDDYKVFPHDCKFCNSLREYDGSFHCHWQRTEERFLSKDLFLRPDEVGIAFNSESLSDLPRNCSPNSQLLLVDRKQFFVESEDYFAKLELQFRLVLPEYNPTTLERKLRDLGFLAYRIRDGEKEQFDYAIRWPKVRFERNKLTNDGETSALLIQLPMNYCTATFQGPTDARTFGEIPNIDIDQLVSRCRFKRSAFFNNEEELS